MWQGKGQGSPGGVTYGCHAGSRELSGWTVWTLHKVTSLGSLPCTCSGGQEPRLLWKPPPPAPPRNAAFPGPPKCLRGCRDKDASSPEGTARNNVEGKGAR